MTQSALNHGPAGLSLGSPKPNLGGILPNRIHLLGAGGAGLSGAARLLLARGHRLSAHDREAGPFTQVLEEYGVPLELGESAESMLGPEVEALVRSAAVPKDDPQMLAALARGIPIWKYAELLGRLAPKGLTLAVGGTHGKTTTTWMLHHALDSIHALLGGAPATRPGALVGGLHQEWHTNALPPGESGWFALEACEYDRSFHHLYPACAAVTNVEADHLDCYGDLDSIHRAFARFLAQSDSQGLVVLGPDVPECVGRAAPGLVWRIGHELRVILCGQQRGCFRIRVQGPGWGSPEFVLRVPGQFNVQNAAVALGLAVGSSLIRNPGLDANALAAAAAKGLADFRGVARRFESWGRVRGIDLVHDYAHHPTEVAATCEAARRVFPRQPLHVLFQPHQHSRTARFLAGFVDALRGCDRVVVADVYGARVHRDSQAAGAPELVERLRRAGVAATLGGSCQESTHVFASGLVSGSAALILGAGNIDGIRDELRDELALCGPG